MHQGLRVGGALHSRLLQRGIACQAISEQSLVKGQFRHRGNGGGHISHDVWFRCITAIHIACQLQGVQQSRFQRRVYLAHSRERAVGVARIEAHPNAVKHLVVISLAEMLASHLGNALVIPPGMSGPLFGHRTGTRTGKQSGWHQLQRCGELLHQSV